MAGNVKNTGTGADANDLSDIRLTTPDYAEVSPVQLPIRGEKRIIPSFVDLSAIQDNVDSGIAGGGLDHNKQSSISFQDFALSAAKSTFVDYALIRVPHRGLASCGRRSAGHTPNRRDRDCPGKRRQ